MRRMLFAVSSLLGLIAAPIAATTGETAPETEVCDGCEALLELAAASDMRKDDRARDMYRNPVETLSFMGVSPSMKVGEYAPGGGWYSRMLGLYLGQQGHLTGLFFNPDVVPFDGSKLADQAAAFPKKVAEWTGIPESSVSGMTLGAIPDEEKGTYDRVLVVRMMHNIMRWNIADSEIKAVRDLLKPGGMLGIVQHRAKPDAPFSYADGGHGYVREADIIKFMEVNGFELADKSEINANPKDSADWEQGVWTLPPSYALKDQDKAKYAAIGESDRMTLLFRKRD